MKYTVKRIVDAYAIYTTEVEASNPIEASEIAEDKDSFINWKKIGNQTFDARNFVTLDENGNEVIGSMCGNL